MTRRILLPLAVFLAALLPATAQPFLPKDCSALVQSVPAPPANDSPAGRADLDTLLQLQAERTPAQVKRAQVVAAQTLTSFAQPVLGAWFDASQCPRTAAIFKEIDHESNAQVIDPAKKLWNRPRPYVYSVEIHPVVARPSNASYPSGHSATAAIWGAILSAAYPDKAGEFQARVHETMWCRELGGVHYPSDTEAGEMLGEAIGKAMLQSPELQADLPIIRDEIAHLNPPTK